MLRIVVWSFIAIVVLVEVGFVLWLAYRLRKILIAAFCIYVAYLHPRFVLFLFALSLAVVALDAFERHFGPPRRRPMGALARTIR